MGVPVLQSNQKSDMRPRTVLPLALFLMLAAVVVVFPVRPSHLGIYMRAKQAAGSISNPQVRERKSDVILERNRSRSIVR
jgi:multisubunit Na+/H+ antiporter MnhC subunit